MSGRAKTAPPRLASRADSFERRRDTCSSCFPEDESNDAHASSWGGSVRLPEAHFRSDNSALCCGPTARREGRVLLGCRAEHDRSDRRAQSPARRAPASHRQRFKGTVQGGGRVSASGARPWTRSLRRRSLGQPQWRTCHCIETAPGRQPPGRAQTVPLQSSPGAHPRTASVQLAPSGRTGWQVKVWMSQ